MKMSQEANKRASGRNPEQIMVVNSNSYVLNKVKALKENKLNVRLPTCHIR